MKMSVGVLDHYNVSTRKPDETVRFYEDILGFMNGPRPPFDFPGAWLYSAGHAVLHLNDISETDKQQRPDLSVIDHVAFGCRGFEATRQHLSGKGVPHHVNQVPNSARWQIFLRGRKTVNSARLVLAFKPSPILKRRVSSPAARASGAGQDGVELKSSGRWLDAPSFSAGRQVGH